MKDYENLIRQRVRQRIFEAAMSGANPTSILLEQEAEAAPNKKDAPAQKDTGGGSAAAKPSKVDVEAAKKKDGGTPKGDSAAVKAAQKTKAAEEVEMVVDTEATEAAKQEFLSQAAIFEKGFDMIKESDALSIARAIYKATKGTESTVGKVLSLGLSGAGTDEEGVKKALQSCPTLMDLSFVSYVYEQKYGGSLKSNFESEFGDSEMYEYVEIPIKETPFISIAGKKYSKEEFQKFAQEGYEFAKVNDEGITGGEVADAALAGVQAASAGLGVLGAAGALASAGSIGALGGAAGLGSAFLGGATAGALGAGAAVGVGGMSATAATATAAGLPVVGATLAAVPGPG